MKVIFKLPLSFMGFALHRMTNVIGLKLSKGLHFLWTTLTLPNNRMDV